MKINKDCCNYSVATDAQNIEECQQVKYMNSLIEKAGKEISSHINTNYFDISKLKFSRELKTVYFEDKGNNKYTEVVWKLYPSEWLIEEEFGKILTGRMEI